MPVESKTYTFALVFDKSKLDAKVQEMQELLTTSFPESFSDVILSNLQELLSDVLIGNGTPTLSADGTNEMIVTLDFGSRLEGLLAALRTRDFEIVRHYLASFSDVSSNAP